MTITTLIGLTDEEYDRARQEYEYEHFQLEEITRYYASRRRRRSQKLDKMRKLSHKILFDDLVPFDRWKRLRARIDKMDERDDRDFKIWLAAMDRICALNNRWIKMSEECKAEKTA